MPHRRSCRVLASAQTITMLLLLAATATAEAGPAAGTVPSTGSASGSTAVVSVIVPVEPYVLVVNRIAEERVDAHTLVPPGQSPHTYSPTPQQIAGFAKADVLFHVGLELERGLVPRLRELDRGLLVVDLMPDEPEPPDAHDHERGHDPHVWLDPSNVIRQAALIAETLSRLDPAGSEGYAAGLDSLVRDLSRLDEELTSRLRPHAGSRFYVFHPAFGHFAEAYGLEQVAVETDGKEPSARRLVELVDMARGDDTRVIITQPQHSDATIRTLAREIDAKIVSIDPLAYDLFATLRALADAITRDTEVEER